MKYQDLIKLIQTEINTHGENLVIDGSLGPKTQAALDKFNLSIVLSKKVINPTVEGKVTTGKDPDEGTPAWYRKMWDLCQIDPGKESQVRSAMKLVEKGMPRYLAVAKLMGSREPQQFAYILGVVHYKEASCDFRGVLHNGQKIIGTGKKTTIVPIGRGPFASWEEAALDAIKGESSKWQVLINGSSDVGDILYALERYNGTGYITGAGRNETSPYLWSCSNINDDKGRYVTDGKFDSNSNTNSTVGAALILKQFALQGAVEFS